MDVEASDGGPSGPRAGDWVGAGIEDDEATQSMNGTQTSDSESERRRARHTSTPTELRVMTFNVFCGSPWSFLEWSRFENQARMLLKLNADVYCLQEVFSDKVARIFERILGKDYIVIRDDSSWATLLIPLVMLSIGFYVVPKTRSGLVLLVGALVLWFLCGTLNCTSFVFGSHRGGLLVILRRDRVELKLKTYRDFNVQSGDPLNLVRRRGYSLVGLTVSGHDLTIVNLHANCIPTTGGLSAEPSFGKERQLQITEAFHAATSAAEKTSGRFIICGDFNANEKGGEIPQDNIFGTRNAWRVANGKNPCETVPLSKELASVWSDTPHGLCLDYQFFGGNLFVNEASLLKKYRSDHLPLLVSYTFTH